jgi:hypothetical protein
MWCTFFSAVKCPSFLRPEGDEWRLIGAAYVHGVMNGEALEILTLIGLDDTKGSADIDLKG